MSESEKGAFDILPGLPPYGPAATPIAGQPFYSEGFVVRFFKANGESWIGNFPKGSATFLAVRPYIDGNLLVCTGGAAYIMNPESPIPIKSFGFNLELVGTTDDNALVLYDYFDITVIEPNGEIWTSEHISGDGFKDFKITKNIVTGLTYNPMNSTGDEWEPFSLNLETRVVSGGSYKSMTAYRQRMPMPILWKIWWVRFRIFLRKVFKK